MSSGFDFDNLEKSVLDDKAALLYFESYISRRAHHASPPILQRALQEKVINSKNKKCKEISYLKPPLGNCESSSDQCNSISQPAKTVSNQDSKKQVHRSVESYSNEALISILSDSMGFNSVFWWFIC